MRFRLKPVVFSLCCAFAYLPAASADALRLRLDRTFHTLPEPVQATSAFIVADHVESRQKDQLEATGHVVLRKLGQAVYTDHLLYFQNTHDLEATGSVRLEQPGSVLSGPHLKLNLDTSIGTLDQPQFYFAENAGRGAADVLNLQDRQHYTLKNASYTTCPANQPDWQMTMGALEIDRDLQMGVAHNAWVTFMGVPLLYSPWMDFPLNDQRKSGFLAPIFGGTSKGGTEITLPYYWNIAPNYDATFSPRIISKRGVLFNNEFRYLAPRFSSEVRLDVLPNDAMANRTRARVSLKHQQALFDGTSGFINFNHVGDDAYFRDLADTVNVTSQVNLLQDAGVTYSGGWWNAVARLQRYQTLQDPLSPIAVPYARLPQITVNGQKNFGDIKTDMKGEFVDFSHPTALNARRLVFNPSVSYPLISQSAFYVTPKLAMHSTHYQMGANNPTGSPNASRTLPILSVDSGVAFERDWALFGRDYLHTLEPRAFYVFIPYQNQSLLPNFDTAQADFSFTQMFAENRFFGNDRIGDANQMTLAMTSRLLDQENGSERLKVTLGERFSFSPPQVNLVAPTSNTGKSDILLAVAAKVDQAWSMDSEFQFDPNQSHTQRYNIAARYRPEPGKVLNFGYRFTRNSLVGTLVPNGTTVYTPIGGLRQVDVSLQWPLTSRWHAVGRWNYSFQEGRILDSIGGLEYNESCWTFRFVGQRFTTSTQQTNTGFFVQLELNDLVKVGSDPLVMLKRSVPGYIKTNEKPNTLTTEVLR
ncbi:MAG: LPS-assembly protein LptD [Gallionella sp.]